MELNKFDHSQDMTEELSSIQHDIWIEWMTYLFQVSQQNSVGDVTIPADKVARWKRQMVTSYMDLTEKEKDSDRKQAQRIFDQFTVIKRGIDTIPRSSDQQKSHDMPDYGLISKPFEKMTERELGILLEQYKIYVEMSDKISERRQQANTFLLTINTTLIAALSTVLSLSQNTSGQYGWILISALAGIIFCLTWRRLIISYRQLNRGKFKIIHELEQYLPARLYFAEWNALNKGDGTLYTEFTKVEPNVPLAFIGLYIILSVSSLMSFVR